MDSTHEMDSERHGDWNIKPDETRVVGGSIHLKRFLELSQSLVQLAEDGQADAHHCGDIDLDVFFMQVGDKMNGFVDEARKLLARGDESSVHRDEVAEQSMESFPASDPPAHY